METLDDTIGTDLDILVTRSTDNGATWTDPEPLNINAATDTGYDYEPELATDGVGNWVAVWCSTDSLDGAIGTDFDCLVARSADNGVTWSAPQPLHSNAATDAGGDISATVFTDRAGNWVAAWGSTDTFGGTLGADRDVMVVRSADNGASWTNPQPLNSHATSDSETDDSIQFATDEAGNWIAVWQSYDTLGGTIGSDSDLLVSRSTDNGEVWTDAVILNTNAALDSGSDDFAQLETDRFGNWIAVWMSQDSLDGTIGSDYDILVARSIDNGVSWTDPELLNLNGDTDGALDRFPAVITDGSGQWISGWYSTDNLGFTIGSDYDMLTARWLLPLCDDNDADLDGVTGCTGDCDDTNPDVYPLAPEICDGIDNQCPGDLGYGEIDEAFPDADLDGVADCIDNCDTDANPGQEDADSDGLGDLCDACPTDADNDIDSDGHCAGADNCPADANPDQSDLDDDQEGDRCDLDDGLILVDLDDSGALNWQEESGYDLWNCYRGDLDILRTEGTYTQWPWDSELVLRYCNLTSTSVPDVVDLPLGATAFYLVTGEIGGVESSLGLDSDGVERANMLPCP